MARQNAVWALACAGALVLGGCGSGRSAGSSARFRSGTGAAVASTSTPPTSAVQRERKSAPPRARASTSAPAGGAPWPGGDRTPPPKVVDQGNDYVAIWYSLDGYRTWLEQHHPDPALIPRVWVTGGSLAVSFQKELSELAAHHARWVDINERAHARVASVTDHEVTLIVDEHNDGDRAIDDAGHVIRAELQPFVAHYVVLMDCDAEGHWRLVSAATQITNDTEVRL
jgi:hypothetical protein